MAHLSAPFDCAFSPLAIVKPPFCVHEMQLVEREISHTALMAYHEHSSDGGVATRPKAG
jgi:hypothetical protein